MSHLDERISLALFLLFFLTIILFYVRVFFLGEIHFSRVDQQGSSRLLHKSVMEMGYWSMQPIAKSFVLLKITPNQISWASLVFGICGAGFLLCGHFGIAALYSIIAVALDVFDGMVARLTGVASDAGEVLDASLDRYVEFVFLAALALYYHEHMLLMSLALLALLGSFMVSYSTAKAEALHVTPPKGSMRRPERVILLTLGALLSGLTVPFEPGAGGGGAGGGHFHFGYPMIAALFIVAIGANFSAVQRLRAIIQTVRLVEK